MSDLKNFLWNNRSETSEKSRFQDKLLSLTEWPDFGFVNCPQEYIVLSAYMIKQPISYKQLKKISNCKDEKINHFLYVCHMLKIMAINEPDKSNSSSGFFNVLSSNFGNKLKAMFF